MSVSTSPAPRNTENKTLEGEYAGFVTRAIAFVIDVFIIDLAVLAATVTVSMVFTFFVRIMGFLPGLDASRASNLGTLVTSATALTVMLLMIWLYPTVFWMINGQTFGKRIMGLRVVQTDGTDMTFSGGLLRVLGYWLSAIPLFLGFIWVLFSNQRRGWHDHLAGTCVIYSWEARGSGKLISRLSTARSQRQVRRKRE